MVRFGKGPSLQLMLLTRFEEVDTMRRRKKTNLLQRHNDGSQLQQKQRLHV
jgi:hypothetical protein